MFGIFSKLFHKQTDFDFSIGSLPNNPQYWPKEWKEILYKEYSRMPKIKLPKNFPNLGKLEDILKNRHSTREFNINKELTISQLSTLLYFSAGVKSDNANPELVRRFYPSGGARYPLEIYLGIQRISGVNAGIYHYNTKEHLLENIGDKQWLDELLPALLYPWSRDAAVIFIITAVWDRNFIKYKDRGYRIVLMEAGHLAQNLALTAAALNIGCCNLVGFHDKKINE
ncbi:MAG: SagB/ThcOx family dehydrogenase, partial [Patescibacteria group bacterium]